MAFYHSLKADICRERHVDDIFAKPAHIEWLKPGVDPNKPAAARPFVPPEAWKGFPGQPIIGGRPLVPGSDATLLRLELTPAVQQKAPWLYGEAPDLQRLIGNAVAGHGS